MNALTWQLRFWRGDMSLEYLRDGSVSRSRVQGQGHSSKEAAAARRFALPSDTA